MARSNASAPTTVAQTVSIYVRIKILGYQIRARARLDGRSEEKGMRKEKEVAAHRGGWAGGEIRGVDGPLVLV